MPVTRSQSGIAASAPREEDRPSVEETADLTVPASRPSSPLRHEDPPKSPSVPVTTQAAPTRAKSRSASSKAEKAKKLARAAEEIAKRKLELAIARMRVLEAESEDDTDNESEGAQERVTSWLENQRAEEGHIDNQPLLPPSLPAGALIASQAPPPPRNTAPEDNIEVIEQPSGNIVPCSSSACPKPPKDSPLPRVEASKTAAPPTPGHIASHTASQPMNSEIAQLTSAITAAVNSAAANRSSKYLGELPFFNGAYSEWLAFRSAYMETERHLTTAENAARLRRALKGKAKEAVTSLLIANAPSDVIMKTLEDRFGRPDTIAIAELDKLRNLPRTSDAPRDICLFANKIANSVATLRLLGKDRYLYSPEIIKNIVEKLPSTTKYRWFDYVETIETEKKNEPELLQFCEFIEKEARRCARYAAPEPITEESTPPYRKQRAHHTRVEGEKRTEERPCLLCKQLGHPPAKCEKLLQASTEDRWTIAKESKLCFRCLRYKTMSHKCDFRTCKTDGCARSHHPLLHFDKPKEVEKEKVTSTCENRRAHTYLKIVPVRVTGSKSSADTFALLDDGSTVTLLDSNIARKIGAKGRIDPLEIETLAPKNLKSESSRRVTVQLRGSGEAHEIEARTIDDLKLSPQVVQRETVWACDHLKDLEENFSYREMQPTILIGQDNWHLLVASEIRRGERRQPAASKTPLGWVLHGTDSRTLGHQVNFVNHLVEDRMDDMLRHHFSIESMGIEEKKPQSDPEQRALDILNRSTQKVGGRFETGMLWKKEDCVMPNNYDNALRRLHSTEKRIDKDPELRKKYAELMAALIEKGYAEKAPTHKTPGKTWYLPHFPVLNPRKPGKVRIVHDAAAKTKGVSLNDYLLTGPDLLQSLPGTLMRFRQHRIAVTADIAEMFMRIGIKEDDRDALRYLWREDRRDGPPDEYRMMSLIFGATSSPATAIFVKDLNARQHEKEYPAAAAAIVQAHYMDDYLHSFQTEEEAIAISKQVQDVHRKGNFHLRGWVSNSQNVTRSLDKEQAEKAQVALDDGTKTEKVLGLVWEPQRDELAFNLNFERIPPHLLQKNAPTKREILKIVMSVYDPLGLASPVTIQAKRLIQEVWRRGIDWDVRVDDDLAEQWTEWLDLLQRLKAIKIPRAYAAYSEASSLQLHIFVDASSTAYASALYWRSETEDGRVRVSLVTAKARVAPVRVTSIPRLELQGAVLGARMAQTVTDEHERKPDARFFWTDSKTVLAWLKNGSRSYKPYVAHRIAAIEDLTTLNEWRWLPSKLNVADDATRSAPPDFGTEHRWYRGPEFLYENSSTWPAERIIEEKETGEERTHHVTSKPPSISQVIPDATRFSSWEKYLRATARVLQFVKKMKPKKEIVNYRRGKKKNNSDPDWRKQKKTTQNSKQKTRIETEKRKFVPIEADLIWEAEKLIVRSIQQETFEEEIKLLNSGKPVPNNSRLRQLSVRVEDGILRIRSRINAVDGVTENQKSPAIIDGDHPAVRLWIEHTHRRLQHAGVETTVNECRQHYWVLRLRPSVRSIVKGCLPCRIRREAPPSPATGDHPPSRLAHHQRPFTNTGVDYFGPVSVTVGKQHHKRYVALFTCLTTRAVHLELAASLSTDSAILALRRLIARRGCPTVIFSDNGTNFHGADAELRRAAIEAMSQEADVRAIKWRFIPPGAPFMGGAWERLVKSVKIALSAVLHERHPSEEVLSTLLAEAEYTVNSRPLTHVSVQPEDDEALTPNHFLLGGSARVPTPGKFDDADLITRSNWRASQRLADMFWARWVREYLPELQHRREPRGSGRTIKEGDVVLIVDSNLPRNTWPRGIVIATYPGQDGAVRVVDVRTKGGVLRRPTKRLVILST
ncbi:uncharacterized protein LOC121732727 [Aricia agestis]|uniref:uncharacterized protein LOC121732727 n=1 Tax=Aricia agestis TaxID=91739 RepID=UPI001C202C3A|nr:uncharacterized protein LOC121732727 [Aricia agestis]